ncbi:hypothetical protein CR513_05301, partial [Mucuna pruriens]
MGPYESWSIKLLKLRCKLKEVYLENPLWVLMVGKGRIGRKRRLRHKEKTFSILSIEKGELLVDKKAKDKVVCDVLSRKPWQFDKKVIQDRVTNQFTFIHMGQRVVLKPLFPIEVHKDQKKIRVKRESMRKLLEEFQDAFLEDIPHGLPPLRGTEHHIHLTLGASLPNKLVYGTNLEEAKEIYK